MLRKRQSAVGNFDRCNDVRANKRYSFSDVYASGAVAKRMFAHGILLSRVESVKQSSKRSACSALSLSRSVGELVGKDDGSGDGLEVFSLCWEKVGSGMDEGLGIGLGILLDSGVGFGVITGSAGSRQGSFPWKASTCLPRRRSRRGSSGGDFLY